MADRRCVALFSLLDELRKQTDSHQLTPTQPHQHLSLGRESDPRSHGQSSVQLPLVGYFLQARCCSKCLIRCHCFSPDHILCESGMDRGAYRGCYMEGFVPGHQQRSGLSRCGSRQLRLCPCPLYFSYSVMTLTLHPKWSVCYHLHKEKLRT